MRALFLKDDLAVRGAVYFGCGALRETDDWCPLSGSDELLSVSVTTSSLISTSLSDQVGA